MRSIALAMLLIACRSTVLGPRETSELWAGIESLEHGDAEEALVAFERANARPHGALALNRALAFHALGLDTKSLSAFDEALTLASDDNALRARIHTDRGIVRAKAGRTLEAIDDFRRALSLDPRDELARHDLEVLLRVLKTPDERLDDDAFSVEALWQPETHDLATVVLAPDPLSDELDLYWRQTTYDTFDGHVWSSTRGEWVAEAGEPVAATRSLPRQAFTFARNHATRQLFGLDQPIRFSTRQGTIERRELDARGFAVSEWVVESDGREPTEPSSPQWRQLPARLDRRIVELSNRLLIGRSTAPEAADTVRRFLSTSYQYSQAVKQPALDPLAAFLFSGGSGDCRLFATAFVVLMRAQGFDARVVGGLHGGTRTGRGRYLLTTRELHAWAEVRGADGWFRVDPTPSPNDTLTPDQAIKLLDAVPSKPAKPKSPPSKESVRDW